MDFLDSFWDLVLVFFWAFIFIAALVALFAIITDLFRDSELSGWMKAVWMVLLIFLPVLTALVYLIVRGGGMAERSAAAIGESKAATDDYIRSVATASPAQQIAEAKELLDAGTITPDEFNTLKGKALQSA
ncbi:SHOCT domain-containing protein [Ornithinimicrobium sp. F0845]|uniref:SHOCT domain-containing protein n=1 Tax=Ornithinimicrobium sp. F0845 TaxID=2926412 RepID=UPI001FF4F56D|nr:SHOCT domain-containing protein [Ornithinimicrobium sp. F0845]MCK0110680.1 SHOCT domain-containing protein [Ornithinimicrobium sp. F0845]